MNGCVKAGVQALGKGPDGLGLDLEHLSGKREDTLRIRRTRRRLGRVLK
jgi:hypothetical protein